MSPAHDKLLQAISRRLCNLNPSKLSQSLVGTLGSSPWRCSRYCASLDFAFYPSFTCHVVPHTSSSSIYRISSNPEMSHTSSSSHFELLFNAALQDYANQTGTKLDEHPLAQQLDNCDSEDSITSVLQEHARKFHEFRGEDGKIMKSLKCAVHVLYTLSTSTALGEGIGLVCRKSPIAMSGPNILSIAIPTCEGSICCFWSLARSTSLSPFPCTCPHQCIRR